MRQLTMEDKALLALSTQSKLSYTKIKNIIETLPDVSVIFSNKDLRKELNFLDEKDYNKLSDVNMSILDNFIANLEKSNIYVITLLSDMYPYNLKQISSPPIVLYAKGNLDLLKHTNCIGIVGTRRCTNYGEEVTKSFSKTLAKSDICIVSGLADGIDTIAHESALSVKGKTIAVMGSGFNNIYPANNAKLADRIIESDGLILTEYEPAEKAQAFHFPARNRIIAGLSLSVLIVEAPARSGALITKEYAVEYNREVFVVPGRITDVYSKGSNDVIKGCQGIMVLGVDEILAFYGKVGGVEQNQKILQLSMEEQIIVNLLEVNDLHYETLLMKSNLTTSQLNPILMKLEIKNIIKKLPGNIYSSIKI